MSEKNKQQSQPTKDIIIDTEKMALDEREAFIIKVVRGLLEQTVSEILDRKFQIQYETIEEVKNIIEQHGPIIYRNNEGRKRYLGPVLWTIGSLAGIISMILIIRYL